MILLINQARMKSFRLDRWEENHKGSIPEHLAFETHFFKIGALCSWNRSSRFNCGNDVLLQVEKQKACFYGGKQSFSYFEEERVLLPELKYWIGPMGLTEKVKIFGNLKMIERYWWWWLWVSCKTENFNLIFRDKNVTCIIEMNMLKVTS